jgi:hypothetical protein
MLIGCFSFSHTFVATVELTPSTGIGASAGRHALAGSSLELL